MLLTHPNVHPAFQELLRKIGFDFPRVNYLTHIDNVRKIAYIETPKVACTSIKKFMMDQYVEGTFELRRPGMVHDRRRSPLKQFKNLRPRDAVSILVGPEYRRFSFVRNPYSRILSGYLDKLVTNEYERARHLPMMGFEPGSQPTLLEFLDRLKGTEDAARDIHFSSQASLLMVEHVEYDFIGRFESFETDFLQLQASYFNVTRPNQSYESFGKHHASNANDKLARYYGPREVALVQEIFKRDFELFGYSEDISEAIQQAGPVDVRSLKASAFRADQLTRHMDRVVAAARAGDPDAASLFTELSKDLAPEKRLVLCDMIRQALPQIAWFAEEGARLEEAQGNPGLASQRWADISERFPDSAAWRTAYPFALVRAGDTGKALIALKKLKKPVFEAPEFKRTYLERGFRMVSEVPDVHLDFALDFLDTLTRKLSPKAFLYELRKLAEAEPDVVEQAAKRLADHLSRSGKAADMPLLTLLFGEGGDHRNAVSNAEYLQSLPGADLVDALGTRVFFLDMHDIEPMRETATLVLKAEHPVAPVARQFLSWVWWNTPVSFAAQPRAKKGLRRKAALCLTGPLRAADSAFQYWQESELFADHDVSVFVHTWARAGQNLLDPKYAGQLFEGALSTTMRMMLAAPDGERAFRATYPALSAMLERHDACDEDRLRRLFDTDLVVVEDERDAAFEGFGHQRKMFHKIAACHQMALAHDADFDVFIQTRPDLYIRRSKRREMGRVLDAALSETRLFCDASLTLCPAGPYIGMQFALGGRDAMDIYAGTYDAIYGEGGEFRQFTGVNRPHVPLAIQMRRNDVEIDAMLQPLTKVSAGGEPPEHEAIMEALSQDVPLDRRDRDPLFQAASRGG